MRKVLPLGVPAGTFSVTGPFSVGTCTLAPSAASEKLTGSVSVRLSPLRPNTSSARHPHPHVQVAGLAAGRTRLPSAGQLDPCTVLDARGDLHLELPASVAPNPIPLHVGTRRLDDAAGRAASPARLRHREEALVRRRSRRLPWHSGHVIGLVPGAAPDPWHVWQTAGPVILTGTVVPAIASSNETLTSVSRSVPRCGRCARPRGRCAAATEQAHRTGRRDRPCPRR